MCVDTFRTGLIFPRTIDLRGQQFLGLLIKMNDFPIFLFGNPHKCVLIPSEPGHCFSEMIDLRGHMPRFNSINEWFFPSHLLGNPINAYSEQASSQDNTWGVNMPRFTWKWTFSQSPWKPTICMLKPQNRVGFPKQTMRVTYLGLLSKWTFALLSPWKSHKCVLKPSEQGSFSQQDQFWGVTCLGLLDKWTFSHLSPWKSHYMYVEMP